MTRTLRPSESDLLPDSSMFDALDKADATYLEKLDSLIDWERFREQLERAWPWSRDDAKPGRPSWDATLMFKILVVGKTKGVLSDKALEDLCRFHARVSRFLRVRPGTGPDARTIQRYRSALDKGGVMETLFSDLEQAVRKKGFEIRDGSMVDGRLVSVPVQRAKKK